MTEADVENINGTSSNETLVKDAQAIDPKAGNLGDGDSDTKQDDNSDIAKPKGKDVAITDVKCDSPKPDNEDEDAQKDGEQTRVNQSQKSDDNQRRGRYHDRNRTSGRFGGRFRISPEEEQRRWEEQQKKKEVLQQGVTGKVKWYSFRKNYGFIQRDDDQQDVFVHQLAIAKSRIRKPTLRTLGHNETVQFDVVQGKKGLEASNVTGPNGTEVQGSHIIFVFKDSFDRPRLPYYNDFNRPAYYNNYLRRPEYHSREVVRPHDRDGGRYQDSRRPFQNNRDRSGYRGERFDRQPYRRQRVYRGRRRSSRSPNPPKEEKVDVKEADASDNKNEVKVNKNGYRRGGRRQFRRSRFFKNNKNQDEGATSAQSDSSTKEATSAKPAEHDKKENQDNTEDIIKGVGAIEVK